MLQAEWMKTKRTAFRYIVLITPIIFPIFILMYISSYKMDYSWQIRVYDIYFQTLGVALPMMASILTGLNIMGEESAGNFRGLITEPMARYKIYLSKLTMLVIITIVDMFISTGILLLGMKVIYNGTNISYGIFLSGTLFTIIGSLFLYGFYLIVSIAFGIGPTIAIGVGGGVWGVLLQTGLGDRIWQFVPWAWSGRLESIPYVKFADFIKFKGLENTENIKISMSNLATIEFNKGMPIALISFVIITILGVLWFEKWEGRKTHD